MNNITKVFKLNNTQNNNDFCFTNWSIVYCQEGSFQVLINGNLNYLSQNHFAVIPPNLNYCILSTEPYEGIVATLNDATLWFSKCQILMDKQSFPVLFALNQCLIYFDQNFSGKEVLLDALGQLIFSYIITSSLKSGNQGLVDEIKETIIKNCGDCTFKIDVYLKNLPFSYEYVRKLFKKKFGCTPHEFLLKTRLDNAKMILSGTNRFQYTVSKVAMTCGFKDPLYFSRVFKQKFGVSPAKYAHRFDLPPKKKVPLGHMLEDDI